MVKSEHRLNELFKELVPSSGKADCLAGEIVRAVSRIGYRFCNDGDRLGIGYGKETCNPAGRFLRKKLPYEIACLVVKIWDPAYNDVVYEHYLDVLCDKVAEYVDTHPELREQPTEDMWDYTDREEDVDDCEDDWEECELY